ncbi:ammonium transporter [Sediminitomix flava]|uniref:Ammonium transporter n=1 Tax=Sediminitomix flava TaxID=379075 RepID=A0A315ZFP2_SEDFL|nr:ammonium transporter [Sediminitomix flava]PWJ43668.1 ammonium transporter [Sediminitomix flava]
MLITQNLMHVASTFAAEATAGTAATAESAATLASQISANALTTNNVWMMLATALVFIMHLGFAGVEAGFTQAKNTVNILFKNTLTPAIGLLSYAVVGFVMMYPSEWIVDGVFGIGFGLSAPTGADGSLDLTYNAGYTYWTDFLFQGMFAATTATIVSGAVAERIKISSYLIFTAIYVSFVYPLVGSWHWGGGFLAELGFHDFAGSTIVHSVGGWAALAGIIVLGPRLGKYTKDGKANDLPGSSVPLAVIGVFLLWLGWFGFNGGSVLSADPASTSLVLVTTSLSACAGAVSSIIAAKLLLKRLDLGMGLNGILAGLVGITAGADLMSPMEAIIIGLISGVIVVVAAISLDKLKLDDCVGAIPVHLATGVFGTLAVGIFGSKAGMDQVINQLIGIGAIGATSFVCSFIIFKGLDMIRGIRVSEEHEKTGLDSHEHGMRGYTIVFDE